MTIDNIDASADYPVSFGYKMAWIAIGIEDPNAVRNVIPISDAEPANWNSGINASYEGCLFISPPIDGWTFVVSLELPDDEDLSGKLGMLLSTLSSRFGEVQYFATHRVVDFHAWALFNNGKELRAFSYLGDHGGVIANRGNKTQGELELGYEYFDAENPDAESDEYWDREDLHYPDEEHVMEVAGKWSINPQSFSRSEYSQGVGFVGYYDNT